MTTEAMTRMLNLAVRLLEREDRKHPVGCCSCYNAGAVALRRCLSKLELAVVTAVRHSGRRLTLVLLRDEVEGLLREPVSEGYLKTFLGRLTGVGVLDNDRSAGPPGYALTADGRALAEALVK